MWDHRQDAKVVFYNHKSANLHTCGCLFQYKEAARAVEAEVSVGVWTVVEMRPNRCCYKLCWDET